MRSSRRITSGLVAALILLGVAPQVAYSSPPPMPPAAGWPSNVSATFIQNQLDLDMLKTWILDQPDVASSGYIDQVHDSNARAVTFLWHGTDDLQRRAVAEATRRNIHVTIEQRSHSLPEITAASNAILDHADDLEAAGFKVSDVVGVQARFDGIAVEGVNVTPKAAASSTETAGTTSAARMSGTATVPAGSTTVADVLARLTDIPVTVVPGVSVATSSGRNADATPFYAGGYMTSGDHTCSTGFALVIGGVAKITTARHCQPPTGTWTARFGSGTYGGPYKTSTDGALLVLTAAGYGRSFVGGIGSTASTPVVGYVDVGINDFVCTGGGNSGQHCGLTVTAMKVQFNDGYGYVSTIRADISNGGIAAIQGDSGGPVFIYKGAGVAAVGMIQGQPSPGWTGSICGTVVDLGNNQCSGAVYFTSIHTVITYGGLGASLATSS